MNGSPMTALPLSNNFFISFVSAIIRNHPPPPQPRPLLTIGDADWSASSDAFKTRQIASDCFARGRHGAASREFLDVLGPTTSDVSGPVA